MAESNKVIFSILADVKSYTEGINKTVDITEAATKAMKIGFAALAATVAGSTIAFAKFEAGMANISTIIDNSKESVKDMGNEILELAKTTPKSISDLVESMYDLRSAGISSSEAMGALKASAMLSATGLSTVKEATDLMTTSINLFKSEGLSAAQMANILFKTTNYGKNTVAQLAQAFGQTAPIAQSLGVTFMEFNAATAALTAQGIPAATAQNTIRAAMVSLAKPTEEMSKIFKKLGYRDVKDLIANSKNLGDAFNKIRTTAEELGIPLVVATGRVEGATAMIALSTAAAKTYNIALDDMKSGVNSIADAYERQSATLMAQKQLLTNMINIVFINLGSRLQPALISMGSAFMEMFGAINDAITKNGSKITSAFQYIVDIGSTAFSVLKDAVTIAVNLFNAFQGHVIVGEAVVAFKYLVDALSLLVSFGKAVTNAISNLLKDLGGLGIALKVVLGSMALFQASQMVGTILKIVESTKLWKAAMFALNLVMKANPVVLITSAVLALGAVIYDVIVNFNEWRLSFDKLINSIMIGWKKAKMLFASDETKAALDQEIKALEAQNATINAQTEALKKRKEELQAGGASSFEADRQAGQELKSGTLTPVVGAAMPQEDLTGLQDTENKKTEIVTQGEQDRMNAKMDAAVKNQVMQEEQNAADMERIEAWYQEAQAKEEERYALEQETLLARKEQENMSDDEYKALKEQKEAEHFARLQAQNDQYWKEKNDKTKKQDTFMYTTQKAANDKVVGMQNGMYSELKETMRMAGENNKTAAKAYQALSIAEALVSTYLGASKALGSMPFPANIAAAALITAQGLMTVSKIKSQSFAVGTDNVTEDMLANIHQGEGIIPAKENQFLQSGKLALVSPDAIGADENQTNNEPQIVNNTAVSFDGANIYGDVDESMSLKIADKIASAISENRFTGFPISDTV